MKIAALIIVAGTFLACSTEVKTESTATESDQSEITRQGKMENLSPNEMAARMKEHPGLILDVRTPQETAEGTVVGAKVLDFYESGFADSIQSLPKDQPVYVYCAAGGRSSEAAKIMIDQGFLEVYNLDGGMGAWNSQGLPTSK